MTPLDVPLPPVEPELEELPVVFPALEPEPDEALLAMLPALDPEALDPEAVDPLDSVEAAPEAPIVELPCELDWPDVVEAAFATDDEVVEPLPPPLQATRVTVRV